MQEPACLNIGGDWSAGMTCESVICPQPVVPVAMSAAPVGTSSIWRVFRLWSDGSVDTARARFLDNANCVIESVCVESVLPASCPADITRNGAVDTQDFLEVLAQWGGCQTLLTEWG